MKPLRVHSTYAARCLHVSPPPPVYRDYRKEAYTATTPYFMGISEAPRN